MDRVLLNTSPTISASFAVGSTNTDPAPDAATVTISRADGTVLVSAATAAQGSSPGQFTWSLTAGVYCNKLDTLTLQWTSAQLGTIVTFVEVCGGFLCPLSDFKALYPTVSDNELAVRRTEVEVELENALGFAGVPRYSREVHTPHRNVVHLNWRGVRALREVSYDSVTWTAQQLADTPYNPTTAKLWYIPRNRLGGTVTIGYEHGDTMPSPMLRKAMQLLALETYGDAGGSYDARVVRREADGQAITYASPSLSHGPFLSPQLNAIVAAASPPLVA